MESSADNRDVSSFSCKPDTCLLQIRSSSAPSSCGRRLIFSVPRHCKFQKQSPGSPSIRFYGVPSQLEVSYMGNNRIIGRNLRGDIIAWNGLTGSMLFHHDSRDFGQYDRLTTNTHSTISIW